MPYEKFNKGLAVVLFILLLVAILVLWSEVRKVDTYNKQIIDAEITELKERLAACAIQSATMESYIAILMRYEKESPQKDMLIYKNDSLVKSEVKKQRKKPKTPN